MPLPLRPVWMHHDMFVKFCGSRLWGSERSAEQTWDNMLADARILKVIDWETDDIARVVMVLVPIPKKLPVSYQ